MLDFLDKLKPLFTNVFLDLLHIDTLLDPLGIGSKQTGKLRIVLSHLLPMLANIHAIQCDSNGLKVLEKHFPDTLAATKELLVVADLAFSRSYLRWLNAPLDFDQHGPRFLVLYPASVMRDPILWDAEDDSYKIKEIVEAVHRV